MKIDWPTILRAHHIVHVDTGPSTSKDNIYVHCPFCGQADGGYHMGISTKGKGWGCWRNTAHRGKAPARLLAALLRIDIGMALRMLGQQGAGSLEADADVLGRLNEIFGKAANDDKVNEHVRMMRDHGRKSKFTHDFVGWNLRFNEIQAAAGRVMLKSLDKANARRREIAKIYSQRLANLANAYKPTLTPEASAFASLAHNRRKRSKKPSHKR